MFDPCSGTDEHEAFLVRETARSGQSQLVRRGLRSNTSMCEGSPVECQTMTFLAFGSRCAERAGREWLFPFGKLNSWGAFVPQQIRRVQPLGIQSPQGTRASLHALPFSGLARYGPQPGHRESRLRSKGARRKRSAGGSKNTWTRACWLALVCPASSVWKDTSERKWVEPRGTG